MKEGLISVVVPIYNVEKYLPRCVESLLAQTYQKLEIILVDDGATDASPAICDEYAKKDARIKVIHKENGGLSDARNAGTVASNGKYIGFVDSDDFLLPDMYEKLVAALEENEADIAVCNYCYVDEAGVEIKERNQNLPIQDKVITGKEAIKNLVGPEYAYWVTAWNRLYRSDIAKSVPFPKGKIHEDEFTAHLFYEKAERVVGVSKAAYQYVVRENSIMTKKYGTRNLDYIDALAGRILYCVEHGMSEEAAAFTRWMQQYLVKVYNRLDKKDSAMMVRYKECWKLYENISAKVSKVCGLGKAPAILGAMFKVAPGLTNKIFRALRP